MKMITIAFPDDTTLPFASSDVPFALELRLAAAIFWHDRGLFSQGNVAECAGLTRADFMVALGRANVSAVQTTVEELKAELMRSLHARRSCIAADSTSPVIRFRVNRIGADFQLSYRRGPIEPMMSTNG